MNTEFIHDLVERKTEAELLATKVKAMINVLVQQCVRAMGDENQVRAAHAMQTLGHLLQGVFEKDGFANFGYEAISVIMVFETMTEKTKELLEAIRSILTKPECGVVLKNLALTLLTTMATATNKLSQNPLVDCMMGEDNFFGELIGMFTSKEKREHHGDQAIALLGLLANHKKFETATPNPYADRLAGISDDVVLSGLASVICGLFTEKNREWTALHEYKKPDGFFTSIISGIFGNADPAVDTPFKPNAPDAGGALLALYETVRLNPNFVTIITHTSILEAPAPPKGKAAAAGGAAAAAAAAASSGGGGGGGGSGAGAAAVIPESQPQEANLLSTFLTFCSFVFTDTSNVPTAAPFVKLCWSIITCVSENAGANAFLHDDNLTVSAVLYRMEMRHRPSSLEVIKSGPLVVALLELCIEFLFGHLKKGLQMDLYSMCLGVIHRVLCYQKRTQTRLNYQWQGLWAALAGLVKFLMKSTARLESAEAFFIADQAVNICNFLMYYGDTLLSNLGCYDQMFYELIREQKTYDSLYDHAKRAARGPKPQAAQLLVRDLSNIRSIVNHFCPRIKSWAAERKIDALTPEQVLSVVRDNYDTLNLKLMDGLDHYTVYAEVPGKPSDFLEDLLQEVVSALRGEIEVQVETIVVLP